LFTKPLSYALPSNRKITRQQKTKKVNGVKTLDLCLLVTHRPILKTLDLYHIPSKEQIGMNDKRQTYKLLLFMSNLKLRKNYEEIHGFLLHH
jgi:hypothetical protein